MQQSICIIIPALNEEKTISSTIKQIKETFVDITHEIIVVDDGSVDETGERSKEAGAKVIRHPVPGGYGNAIKSGIYATNCPILAIIDADGTYPAGRLRELYQAVVDEGYHMAVGARTGKHYHGGKVKRWARYVFKFLADFSSGKRIPDINSGMRVFRKQDVMLFYDTLCNGFSLTTTITLAYMIKGYLIKYIPIEYYEREGSTKVRHISDSLGSLQIIVQSICFYNPLKVFLVLNMFLCLAFIASLLVLAINGAVSAVILFFFCSFFLLFMGMGFVGVGVSFVGMLLMNQNRDRKEYAHFKNQISTD